MAKISNIVVLGDSVAWGQGLLAEHKYASQIRIAMGAQPALQVLAHSDAIIGITFTGNQKVYDPEVPKPTPTVMTQVDLVQNPSDVDLVLLTGGINDVGFANILDPLADSDYLQRETTRTCYQDMKRLLSKIVKVFNKPTCVFVLSGYYPILSTKSAADDFMLNCLEQMLIFSRVSTPNSFIRGPMIDKIVSQTLQFWRQSDSDLHGAVDDTRLELGLGARIIFVPNAFSEDNALFAGQPWLFGFTTKLAPEDEVIGSRNAQCLRLCNPLDIPWCIQCHFASVGHPNVYGAQAIAIGIINALRASGN